MTDVTPASAQQSKPQEAMSSLTGTVIDPVGALIPQATITLQSPDGKQRTLQSDSSGSYSASGLSPGLYTVTASAPGFASYRQQQLRLTSGQTRHLNITLQIQAQDEQVVVSEDAGLSSSAAETAGATIIKGSSLDALSNDRSQLQIELQAMAGGDGESGNQIYVDGFSGGKLPPKDSIREIRINQNPYSAQYDSMGWGRVEIFTKPGANKLHGELSLNGNNSPFNTRNKFVSEQPPYYSYGAYGNVTGPISKKASYFFNMERWDSQNNSIIKAEILDSNLNQTSLSQALSTPTINTTWNPRLDWQATKNDTVTLRYQLDRSTMTNAGIGQFSLISQGYDSTNDVHTWQLGVTHVFGPRVIDEMRFQYIRTRANQVSRDLSPTTIVQGSFNGGGNNLGAIHDKLDQYEFQDYVSVSAGSHYVRFGGRLRFSRDSNSSTANYNGEFIFPTLTSYQITQQGLRQGLSAAQIRANGGGASQFNISAGTPSIVVSLVDAGLYAEDEWKLRKNLTLNFGMRFETQSEIKDHADWSPRIGLNWGLGAKKDNAPKYVIRGGYGWFYQRFVSSSLLQARRQNGELQREYVVSSPDFYPNIPSLDSLAASTNATTYRINPNLQAPISMVAGIGIERSLGKYGTVALNYRNSRSVHSFLTRNINAPLPGTYDPNDPSSGTRPYGGNQNIYEYESEGAGQRNFVSINANVRGGKRLNMFGFYGLGFNRSNASGIANFPSNQYDLHLDYGRSAYDTRNRAYIGGSVQLPYRFHFNSMIFAQSSMPFNIVLGHDLNGDSQYNDRPAFATDLARASVVKTKWGTFDTSPTTGQTTIPINFGKGPSIFMLNTYLSRSFSFGPEVKDASPAPAAPAQANAGAKKEKPHIDRQYELEFGVYAGNVLNHVNLGQPVGTLSSPLFGRSTSLFSWFSAGSANRVIELSTRFHF